MDGVSSRKRVLLILALLRSKRQFKYAAGGSKNTDVNCWLVQNLKWLQWVRTVWSSRWLWLTTPTITVATLVNPKMTRINQFFWYIVYICRVRIPAWWISDNSLLGEMSKNTQYNPIWAMMTNAFALNSITWHLIIIKVNQVTYVCRKFCLPYFWNLGRKHQSIQWLPKPFKCFALFACFFNKSRTSHSKILKKLFP